MEPSEEPIQEPRREAAVMFAELIGAAELSARAGDAAAPHMAAYAGKTKEFIASRVIHILQPA